MKHRTTREYLTKEETVRLIDAAYKTGPREHAMFLFALAHGARVSEICNLKILDLGSQVRIRRLKNSEISLQNYINPGPIEFNELEAFKKYMEYKFGNKIPLYVFGTLGGSKPISRIQVYRLFRKVCERAGIPESKRHPHVLKHTLAMRMLEAGESAFVIQKALGHKNIQNTLVYAKPTDAQASEAINRSLGIDLKIEV